MLLSQPSLTHRPIPLHVIAMGSAERGEGWQGRCLIFIRIANRNKKERREQWRGEGREEERGEKSRREERRRQCLGLTVLPLIPVGYSQGSSNSPPHPGDRLLTSPHPSYFPPIIHWSPIGRSKGLTKHQHADSPPPPQMDMALEHLACSQWLCSHDT
ncbi:hypothetical protein F7725_016659, partial [Dissostichus mawsoni]